MRVPSNRRTKQCIVLVLLGVGLLGAGIAGYWFFVATGEIKLEPKFTIAKDTTYATGPCDAEGFIDYAAALNERLQQGVTADNNANVLLWKAIGPHPEDSTIPDEFFRWMGIPAPPEQGEYFVGPAAFVKERKKGEPVRTEGELSNELELCMQRPWAANQFPLVADWIKTNEKPLLMTIQASKRLHYFSPLLPGAISGDTKRAVASLIGARTSGPEACRKMAMALVARAMLSLDEKRYDDAWRDLLASHRLGRLVAHGGSLIEGLMGIGIDAMASEGDVAFLDAAGDNAALVRKCLRELQELPPMPSLASKMELAERFMFLELVLITARHGWGYLEATLFAGFPPSEKSDLDRILAHVDWDAAMRVGNRWYDRLAAAMRIEDRAAREKQLATIESETRTTRADVTVKGPKILRNARTTDSERGRILGELIASLTLPATLKARQRSDRVEQAARNVRVAFAIAAFHCDHGHYPGALDALVPAYFPTFQRTSSAAGR